MVELIHERGYAGVTVRGLSRAAGVSTRTFYKHFANVEECFASTYESLMRCALRQASASRAVSEDWERDVRAGLRGLTQGLADHPKAAHLALVDFSAAGPAMRRRVRLAIREFEQLLAEAFAEAPGQVAVPPRAVQGMVAGVMRVARTRLVAVRGGELPEIVDELGDWVLSLRDAYVADEGKRASPLHAKRRDSERERSELAPVPLYAIGDERGRVLTAAAKLGAGDGYRALTIPRIRVEAGVSRRSFDAQFAGLDDCLLEAIEVLVIAALVRAERRAMGASSWEHGVYRATVALCAEIARHPTLARLSFIDILAAGRAGLLRRERLVGLGADRLRRTAPPQHRPTELAAEASMAAAWKIVEAEIAAGRGKELPRIAPAIASVLIAPARGTTARVRIVHIDD